MKLRPLLMATVCFICFAINSSAQTPQVNNSGFENWETTTLEMAEPLEWNSFRSASGPWAGAASQQLNKSTQTRPGSTGQYSAVIWAKFIISTTANGNLTTGQINMGSTSPSSPDNYNVAHIADPAFSETLGAYPDSLVVWVRSKIANVLHQPKIQAVIHDNYDVRNPPDAASLNHITGTATLNFTTTGNLWVRKSIPFIYTNMTVSPSYIMVVFTTSKDAGVGTAGDSLYVDDLQLIYNPVLTTGSIAPTSYIVSSSSSAPVSVPFVLTGTMNPGNIVTAQLSDGSGSFASPVVLGTLATTTSGTISGTIPAGTPTGAGYRIRVVSSDYALTAADNGTDILISDVTGLETNEIEHPNVFFTGNELVVEMQNTALKNSVLRLYSITGKELSTFMISNSNSNRYRLSLPAGVYIYRITSLDELICGKVMKL